MQILLRLEHMARHCQRFLQLTIGTDQTRPSVLSLVSVAPAERYGEVLPVSPGTTVKSRDTLAALVGAARRSIDEFESEDLMDALKKRKRSYGASLVGGRYIP